MSYLHNYEKKVKTKLFSHKLFLCHNYDLKWDLFSFNQGYFLTHFYF